jgi:glyoxylase-like metal-dependent hydrolase (beta-lactamase superfamily II)
MRLSNKARARADSAGHLAQREELTMELSRRDALAGAATLVAVPLLPSHSAQAAAPVADKQAPSFYRYKVGDIQVNAISDGTSTFTLDANYISNAKIEEINAALDKAFLPKNQITTHYAPLVLNIGGKVVVIDTGNGPGAFATSKGKAGQFVGNMTAAGFDPAKVDTVVISHFHGDHVNGLLNADGSPVYANAEVMVPATEWKFWMDDGEMSRASGERMSGLFKNNRRIFDAGLKKKVTPYEWDKDVVPGLHAIASIGHTPGHTSYVLSSGSETLFIQSDVTNLPALFTTHPDWHVAYDQDPAQAETTRRKVYDMLVADRMRVQGFHYPFPANGFVEKDGNGYRLVPAPWSPNI